jgi:hypothetical protein
MKGILTKSILGLTLIAVIGMMATGCATIVSDSTYTLRVETEPQGANIEIKNKYGMVQYTGVSPQVFQIEVGDGFFKKARYTIDIKMDGHPKRSYPLLISLDGWYFGNLIFPGVIGLLIIDPVTGAMWELDTEYIFEVFDEDTAEATQGQRTLKIMDYNEVPDSLKDKLIPVE